MMLRGGCNSATDTTLSTAGRVAFSITHCRIKVVAGIPSSAACSRTFSTNDCDYLIYMDTNPVFAPAA